MLWSDDAEPGQADVEVVLSYLTTDALVNIAEPGNKADAFSIVNIAEPSYKAKEY